MSSGVRSRCSWKMPPSVILHFDNIQSARLLIWKMKVLGMWDFAHKPWNKYYHLYGWTLHCIFTFLFILCMYINVGLVKDLDALSDALYMSLTETALLAKAVNIMAQSRVAVELLALFERSAEATPRDSHELCLVARAHAGFARLRNYLIGASAVELSLAFSMAFYERSLPYPTWLPFDYHDGDNFYYAYFYVLGGMVVTAASNCAMDLLQAYLLFQLSVYYKLLCHRLASVTEGTEDVSAKLSELFEFHTFIARSTAASERLISWPVAVQILISALVLCFTVYRMQAVNFLTDPSLFFKFLCYTVVMALQIYIPCTFGDDLTESAAGVMNAVYKCDWVDLPMATQRQIFVYMEYLQRPVVVRAGNFFDIGLRVFTQTINNAYSLYALMLNMEV